jgi:iron-only hydrogenase group A
MSELEREEKQRREITRRKFLQLMSGLGLAGVAVLSGGCLKPEPEQTGGRGWLPPRYAVPDTWPDQWRGKVPISPDDPALVLDDRLCDLCGRCVEACQRTQSVFGHYQLPIKDEIICVHCGQCALYCSPGAIHERDDTGQVAEWLRDPNKFVVVQTAPATRVSLGEEFGLTPGTWVAGQQVAALRRLGFDAVMDTNFTADLTIMEEATELIKRIKGEYPQPLPLFTSCSPGWVKFCEYFYPELLPHLSTCKSPQQMFGALAKTYYAQAKDLNPEDIVSVAIMPCTAKKFEAKRPEMNSSGIYWGKPEMRDVDAVLTTRELARMLKKEGLHLTTLPAEEYNSLMGESTGSATIFGATGGVMEAAVRTAYFFITKDTPPPLLMELTPVRGLAGVKEGKLTVPGAGQVQVAVVHGLANARTVLETVKAGQAPWHFIEFMCCPGGCISGGGQPKTVVPPSDEVRWQRIAALYEADVRMARRESHENAELAALYRDFLDYPLSKLAYKLLHTKYHSRADKLVPLETSRRS